jgi:hypothetical protein
MTTPAHELLVQCVLDSDTALPKDRVVNTFHFGHGGATWLTANLDAVQAALNSFYNTAHTGSSNAIANFLSARLAGTWTMKMYDLEDDEPRVPIREVAGTTMTPGATSYPTEVALCLSYQGAKISGFDQASRRGRLFIGPLSTSTGSSTTGLPVTSADGVVDTLCAAGTYLAGGSWAVDAETWDVFSQKFDTSIPVTDGWVDNAFDTQRRRGEAPTTRQLWT